ncbi:sugar transporter [Sphingorhabdus sp.]|uniref:sugar transporter n=1 Tax=Sphingorhabdus sp. TaxID=1902408 RepID=UPI003BB0D7CD|nr:sugar transporter [Sphingomonadales bacterium]MBL0021549.1 sugar transporter [Sphingomonadales bacterium]
MENRGPRWLTIAGIVSLLWNLMGVWSFVTNWQLSKTGYAGLPDVQRELWSAMPVWTWAAFAIAVGCGTAAALALLLRKRIAVQLFLVSFIAILVQFSWPIFMNDAFSKMGAELVTFPIILALAGIIQWYFARRGQARGWLN